MTRKTSTDSKVLTSDNNPLGIGWVSTSFAGRLGITIAPGKHAFSKGGARHERNLAKDLDRLVVVHEAKDLVCLLEDHELASLKIRELISESTRRGLTVHRLPIPDGGVLPSLEPVQRLVATLTDAVAHGRTVIIHCAGGLGRSGLVAGCFLAEHGMPAEDVLQTLASEKVRGPRCPETPGQKQFIREYAAAAASRRRAPSSLGPRVDCASPVTREERIAGALFGLAIGDALGAPVEFMDAREIADRHGRVSDMMAGGPWLTGEWTDDTALTLATSMAYDGKEFDLKAAADAMVAWKRTGPKDIGNLTRAALNLLEDGRGTADTAGEQALHSSPGSAGNGSLMRAAPTGLVRCTRDPRLAEESEMLSAVTHADSRCKTSCVALNVVLATLLETGGNVEDALARARLAVERRGGQREVLELIEGVIARAPPRHSAQSIGYVLLCLERGLIALRDARSFEEGVLHVVNLGGDSDTNAAVAGGLLGARFGVGAIPDRFRKALRNPEPVKEAVDRLLAFARSAEAAVRCPK